MREPSREDLPTRGGSMRLAAEHDGAHYLVTVSRFADGRLAEIFIDAAKPSSALAVHASDAAVPCSLLLQYNVPAATIRHSISGPIAAALDAVADNKEWRP